MSEWVEKPLGELAAIRVSNVDKKSQATEHPVRLCNYMDVYVGTYLDDEVEYMEATASGREIANFSLQSGDVVITKDSESPDDIGIPALIDQTTGGLVCGYHLAMLRPDKSKVDPLFLLKQIETDAVRRFYLKQAAGSTRYALATGTIESTPIRLAPLDHQRIIARILRALDTQIEATEGLIAKQERVRAGLMQDLFTRGVDEHGQLRPPRVETPHLYHQTELGWLPFGWEVSRVGDLITAIEQGWSPDCLSEPAQFGEWGILKTSSVTWSGFKIEENKKLPSALGGRQSLTIKNRDVLMTRAGPNSRVGVVSLVDCDPGMLMLSDKIYRLQPNASVEAGFLASALSSDQTQRELDSLKTGLAESQTNISQAIVRRLRIGIAPKLEQAKLFQIAQECKAVSTALSAKLGKLRLKKSGLMQDLLTGKVSVAPLLESLLESVPA